MIWKYLKSSHRVHYLFESNSNIGSLVNEVGFENNLLTLGSGFSFQLGGIAANDDGDFVNNETLSMWTEFSGDFSETMEWGLFGGYAANGGFGESITYVDGFLGTVENAFRVSPRIGWKSGSLKIGLEGEFTNAQYGSIATNGDIISTADSVNNFRLLTTAIYKF